MVTGASSSSDSKETDASTHRLRKSCISTKHSSMMGNMILISQSLSISLEDPALADQVPYYPLYNSPPILSLIQLTSHTIPYTTHLPYYPLYNSGRNE